MKKTHKGKTANQLLQTATVGFSSAGMAHVWVGDYQCYADEGGNLVMMTADERIHLECGKRAGDRLEQLLADAEAMAELYDIDLIEAA